MPEEDIKKPVEIIVKDLKLIELEGEGQGTFGKVVKALDPKTRKFYALKKLSALDKNGNFN